MVNFTKEILFVFDTPDLMYAKEAELVNEDFLAIENTYNLKVGGFDFINSDKNDEYINIRKNNGIKTVEKMRQIHIDRLKTDPEYKEKLKMNAIKGSEISRSLYPDGTFKGKHHTDETKNKMSESKKITSSGERNSEYGTRWIHSLELKVSKKVKKEYPLPNGWIEGRKIKFS